MKNIVIFLILLIVNFSCSNDPEFFTVSGEVNNANGEKLYFAELQSNSVQLLDSIILNDKGVFSFKGKTEVPGFYTLKISSNNYITLVINPYEQVVIKADGRSLSKNPSIEGSPDSEKINILRSRLMASISALDSLGAYYRSLIGTKELNRVKDSLSKVSQEIIQEHTEYTKEFIRNNKNSLAALMALYQQIAPRRYILNPAENMEYFEMVDSSLMATIPESEAVKTLHTQMNELKRQLELKEEQKNSLGIGAVAPDIVLPGPEGDTIALSSLRGRYVLLDFWASWCRPCRVENPNLVQNYEKYKNKGFEIFQVSLDKKRESWIEAIEKDKLNWTHVSDLKYWNSSAAKLYNVQAIPASFLLDKNGKIIAKNLRGDMLEAKLSELFD